MILPRDKMPAAFFFYSVLPFSSVVWFIMQYAVAFSVVPGPPLVCSELTCWRLQKWHLSCQLTATRKVRWQCSILKMRIKSNVKDILYLGLRCLLRATWDSFREKCIVFDYSAPLLPTSGEYQGLSCLLKITHRILLTDSPRPLSLWELHCFPFTVWFQKPFDPLSGELHPSLSPVCPAPSY